MAINKVMLWGVTALAVASLLFPSYVGALFGTGSDFSATENMNRVVVHVEGMTCEGCATTVAQAIRRIPGVAAADVSYEKSGATVGVLPGDDVSAAQILEVLRIAGYKGTVLTDTSAESDHLDQAAANTSGNIETTEMVFRIDGMSCEACATSLAKSLRAVPGVIRARVDFESRRAWLHNASCCAMPADAVLETIEKAGFRGQKEESVISHSRKGDQQ